MGFTAGFTVGFGEGIVPDQIRAFTNPPPAAGPSPQSKEAYTQLIPQIEAGPGGPDGAAVIGLHLEGPFIAAGKKVPQLRHDYDVSYHWVVM